MYTCIYTAGVYFAAGCHVQHKQEQHRQNTQDHSGACPQWWKEGHPTVRHGQPVCETLYPV